MTVALKAIQCCSWQHASTNQCWYYFYVEQQGRSLGVEKPRNHEDAAVGAATEGRWPTLYCNLDSGHLA